MMMVVVSVYEIESSSLVNIKILAFPNMLPCSLVYRHQRFGTTYCFFFSEDGNGVFLRDAVDQ